MDALKNHYRKVGNGILVKVMEMPSDYTGDCLSVVERELEQRNIPGHELKRLAFDLMKDRIQGILKKFAPLEDRLYLPHSHYLDKNEVYELLKVEFEEWLKRKGDFEINVWHYSMGAIMI